MMLESSSEDDVGTRDHVERVFFTL
jgi:hypothetical protein